MQFEIQDPESGLSITVEGSSAPSQEQAATILSQHKAAHPPPRRAAPVPAVPVAAAVPSTTGTATSGVRPGWVPPPPADAPEMPAGFQPPESVGKYLSRSPLIQDVGQAVRGIGRDIAGGAGLAIQAAQIPSQVAGYFAKRAIVDPARELASNVYQAGEGAARWAGEKARQIYRSPFVQDYVLPSRDNSSRVRVRAPNGQTGTVPIDQADKLPKGWQVIKE